MNQIVFGILIFILIFIIISSTILVKKFTRMEKKRKQKTVKVIIFSIMILFVFNGISYIPKTISDIDFQEVSLIEVKDGNTGECLKIEDRDDIKYIIDNLNNVTFKKGKFSSFYVGYGFKTKIYNSDKKVLKELIINSEDVIRYKGHFHKEHRNQIDYDYILNLYK